MVTTWRRLRDRLARPAAAPRRTDAPPDRSAPTAAATAGDASPTRSWRRDRAAHRVLFINQYYWPDHASTAQHLSDLAEALAARGYDCHVVCSRGGYRPGATRLPAAETHHGVRIHRVGATSLGRRTTLRRMADYLSFYAGALLRCLALHRADVVVTLTTPPILGLLGTLLRLLKGSRHVYWSMDLHPDASVALGRMDPRNPFVAALTQVSNLAYRNADRVVVLGSHMGRRVADKGVDPGRMVSIPVWSRRDEIYPLPRAGHPLRRSLGLDDKFVAMYSGNLGLAHCFEEFLGAARRLRDRDDVVFLFVGDGPRLAEVRAAKEAEGLDNVRLLDYFPREQLYASLSVADVHLISMRPEMAGIVVPGKLYGAMASGRPTLFVGPEACESAETIRRAGCGLVVPVGDADAVVAAIERLAADPAHARALGERGRSAFLGGFERDGCCDSWAVLVGQLAAPPRPAPAPHATSGRALAGLTPLGDAR